MTGLTAAHAARMRDRKLDPQLCEKLGIHSRAGALAIDYRLDGSVHNTKFRRGKGNMPWEHEAKHRPIILWNIDSLKDDPEPDEFVIITEGELDGVACIQAGFTRVVSVPNGAPASENEEGDKRYKYLFDDKAPVDELKLIPELEKFSRFILAVDGDSKGRILREALAIRLGADKCYWVEWPEGCKDANDQLIEEGANALFNQILAAKPMWNNYLHRISDAVRREAKVYPGAIFGMDLNIELPSFMVMMGPYHCGKSVFLRQFLWSQWKTNGFPFLLTCLEEPLMDRVADHFRVLQSGLPKSQWTEEVVVLADREIEQAGLFLQRPWGSQMTPDDFLSFVELAARRDGVKVVALDPINELDHSIGKSETQYWGEFIIECKKLADKYKLLFVACGHPPKDAYRNMRDGQGLYLSDMSGSQHWGNKADVGMVFWKPPRKTWFKGGSENGELPTLCHLEKLKDHETMGKPALYELEHIATEKRFRVAGKGWDLLEPGRGAK